MTQRMNIPRECDQHVTSILLMSNFTFILVKSCSLGNDRFVAKKPKILKTVRLVNVDEEFRKKTPKQ